MQNNFVKFVIFQNRLRNVPLHKGDLSLSWYLDDIQREPDLLTFPQYVQYRAIINIKLHLSLPHPFIYSA